MALLTKLQYTPWSPWKSTNSDMRPDLLQISQLTRLLETQEMRALLTAQQLWEEQSLSDQS